MAFPVSSKPVSVPTQPSVNQNNGNFEKALEGDTKAGGQGGSRGGISGEVVESGDRFEQAKQTGSSSTGVVLNPDDLL
jgi:hypothetical protein